MYVHAPRLADNEFLCTVREFPPCSLSTAINITKRQRALCRARSMIFHTRQIKLFSLGVHLRRQGRKNTALRFRDQKSLVLQPSNVRGVRYYRDRSEVTQFARPTYLQLTRGIRVNSAFARRIAFRGFELHVVRRSPLLD